MTGCTGDLRVFAKYAKEIGLEFVQVRAAVEEDYTAACYENGRRLERRKKGSHINGHAAAAVRRGGRWHVLDTIAYDQPAYARSGPAPLQEVVVDSPDQLLGKELHFGYEYDPYIVTAVDDGLRAPYTYREIMEDGAGGCRFPAAAKAAKTDPPCRFEGTSEFDDGLSLDFACGRCFIHRDNMVPIDLSTGTVCGMSRHESNGKGGIKDCLCVTCPRKTYAFYGAECRSR